MTADQINKAIILIEHSIEENESLAANFARISKGKDHKLFEMLEGYVAAVRERVKVDRAWLRQMKALLD